MGKGTKVLNKLIFALKMFRFISPVTFDNLTWSLSLYHNNLIECRLISPLKVRN